MANPTGGTAPAKLDLDAALQRNSKIRALMFLDSTIAELNLAERVGISPMRDYYRARRAALAFELGIADGEAIGFGHGMRVPPQ